MAGVLSVLAIFFTWRTASGPTYIVPITDFARDLMGADAVRNGLSPYQRLGELAQSLPNWDLRPEVLDHWVAHSPFAIALAGLTSTVFGSHAETVFRIASWVALGVALSWVGIHSGIRYSVWSGVSVAAAAATSFGIAPEMWYLHGASIAGLALIGFYVLEKSEFRRVALVLLGVLIAWRPWLAPLTLFLPHRRRLLEDISWVAATSIAVTLIPVAWMGGTQVLRDWVQVALPGNFADVQDWPWNLSVLGSHLPAALSTLVFVAVAAAFLVGSRFVTREHWLVLGVVVILLASPLVWPQYWWNLTPVIVLYMSGGSPTSLLLVLLGLSAGVAGVDAFWGQTCVALTLVYLLAVMVRREGVLRRP